MKRKYSIKFGNEYYDSNLIGIDLVINDNNFPQNFKEKLKNHHKKDTEITPRQNENEIPLEIGFIQNEFLSDPIFAIPNLEKPDEINIKEEPTQNIVKTEIPAEIKPKVRAKDFNIYDKIKWENFDIQRYLDLYNENFKDETSENFSKLIKSFFDKGKLCRTLFTLINKNHLTYYTNHFSIYDENTGLWTFNISSQKLFYILGEKFKLYLKTVHEKLQDPSLEEMKNFITQRINDITSNFTIGYRFSTEMRQYFNKSNLDEKIDLNLRILAFNDVVLDLDTFTISPHNPDFYITKKLKYDFPGFDFPDNKIDSLILNIFPDEEKREYLYDLLAGFLSDKISNDKLHIFVGRGSNGLSLLIQILRLIFDFYIDEYDATNLATSSRNYIITMTFIEQMRRLKAVFFHHKTYNTLLKTIMILLNKEDGIWYII